MQLQLRNLDKTSQYSKVMVEYTVKYVLILIILNALIFSLQNI